MVLEIIEPEKPLVSSNNENEPKKYSMQLVNTGNADGSKKRNLFQNFFSFFYKCCDFFKNPNQTNFLKNTSSTRFGNGPFAFMADIGGSRSRQRNTFVQLPSSRSADEFKKRFPRLAMSKHLSLLGGSGGGPRRNWLSMAAIPSDGNTKPRPFSMTEPSFLALYQRSLAEGKYLWCGRTEVKRYNVPCGHELWCVGFGH